VATPLRGSATSQPGSPDSPATPASLPGSQYPGDCGPDALPRDDWKAMSTRYLIVIALITGLVILAASAVQFLMAR
jgi:hypothetical protein